MTFLEARVALAHLARERQSRSEVADALDEDSAMASAVQALR